MPHINAFIRDEYYPIYEDLKATGLWPDFIHDCLKAYNQQFRQPAILDYAEVEERLKIQREKKNARAREKRRLLRDSQKQDT